MPITLIRVVNQQKVDRSILIDKLDDGQANTEGYANFQKQKVYVPYWNDKKDANGNLIDSSVKGYVDYVPTDRVLLSADDGTIEGLARNGWISTFAFSSTLTATPVVTGAHHAAAATTIGGSTTFVSVTPDLTYVTIENLGGTTQKIPQSAFTSLVPAQIVIPDAAVTIGVPGVGWKVIVQANSKSSNQFTLT